MNVVLCLILIWLEFMFLFCLFVFVCPSTSSSPPSQKNKKILWPSTPVNFNRDPTRTPICSSHNPLILQSEPSAPPQEVKCTSPSSTSILVSWKPPPVELQNGVIIRYSIQYTATEGDDMSSRHITDIPPQTSRYLLENLEKWTEYRVTVIARTEAGESPESLTHLIRTEEDGMFYPHDPLLMSLLLKYSLTPVRYLPVFTLTPLTRIHSANISTPLTFLGPNNYMANSSDDLKLPTIPNVVLFFFGRRFHVEITNEITFF